jgi:hypothetical protein
MMGAVFPCFFRPAEVANDGAAANKLLHCRLAELAAAIGHEPPTISGMIDFSVGGAGGQKVEKPTGFILHHWPPACRTVVHRYLLFHEARTV